MSTQADVGDKMASTNHELHLVNKQLDKVVRLMQLSGTYVHNADTRRLKVLYMIYPVILLLYQGFVVIAKLTTISFTDAFGPTLFYNLLAVIFRIYILFIFCIPTLKLGTLNRFRKEFQLIWLTKSENYQNNCRRKLSLLTNISIGIVLMSSLGSVGNVLSTCTDLNPVQLEYSIPLWSQNWSNELQMSLCIVCAVIDLLMFMCALLFTVLFIITWYLLKSEFDNINAEVYHFIETQHITFESCIRHKEEVQLEHVIEEPRFDLEDLRLHHDVICHMVDMANGLFKFQIFATCGVSLLVTCITVYYFAKVDESVDILAMLVIVIQLAMSLCTLVMIIITGTILNDKVS